MKNKMFNNSKLITEARFPLSVETLLNDFRKRKQSSGNLVLKVMVTVVLAAILLATMFVPVVAASDPPSFTTPTDLSEMVDEIRAILFTFSPESVRLMETFTTTARPNLPIPNDFQRPTRIVRDNQGNILPEHSITVNEFIAIFSHPSDNLFINLSNVTHYIKHYLQSSARIGYTRAFVERQIVNIPLVPAQNNIIRSDASLGNLPEHLRTFRWASSVSSSARITANMLSVYGILEELAAYYFDTLVPNQATGYVLTYLDRNGFDFDFVLNWYHASTHRLAFYEHVFWTVHHLLFLYENHPNQFAQIMGNAAYRRAFAYTYASYRRLLDVTAPANVETVFSAAENMGISVWQEQDVIWFDMGRGTKRGITMGPSDYLPLRQELATPRYAAMLAALRDNTRFVFPQTTLPLTGIDTQPQEYEFADPNIPLVGTPAQSSGSGDGGNHETSMSDETDICYAQMLFDLGLFRGTGVDANGNPIFYLEGNLTRLQAIILTIRLLGLENAAHNFTGANPFEDVESWSVHYAAFAFSEGITAGISATEFAPNRLITFHEFTVFLLRVLGFDDRAGDFIFAEAIQKAVEIGMFNNLQAENFSADVFLRVGAVSVMSYALLVYASDSAGTMLIDILFLNDVITEAQRDTFVQNMKK